MYTQNLEYGIPCPMGSMFGRGPDGYGVNASGGGGGGGDIPADTSTTIRYAEYIEGYHQAFLATVQQSRINADITENYPYTDYTFIEPDAAFFGAGYVMASYPSLYDMYGKFMAGLDVEVLWTQNFEETVNPPEVGNVVAAEAALMDDDIDTNSIPRLQTGMRDINSIMASTYVVGKAMIEDARTKALEKFSAELKYRLIPVAQSRWQTHLEWNKGVIGMYAELMKFYFSTRIDVDEANYSYRAKQALWPFNALDFERAALGALQGATNSRTEVAGQPTQRKVITGALSGAAMGAMVGAQTGVEYGGAYGALIGGVLGGLAGSM